MKNQALELHMFQFLLMQLHFMLNFFGGSYIMFKKIFSKKKKKKQKTKHGREF